MLVEALVFGIDRSLRHIIAHFIEGIQGLAVFQVEFGEQRGSIRCVDARLPCKRVLRLVFVVGKILEPGIAQDHGGREGNHRKYRQDRKDDQKRHITALVLGSMSMLQGTRSHSTSISGETFYALSRQCSSL